MHEYKMMKEQMIAAVQTQMAHLDCVDAAELGEAIDIIKDLEEACYYHTITEAMKEKETEEYGRRYYPYPEYRYDEYEHRDRDKRYYNKMSEPYHETEYDIHSGRGMSAHDRREGRSGMTRKTYMEGKETHQPTTTQMRELEKYLQELASDVTEMIEDASPEEKAFMEKKISALAAKINA